MEKWGCERLGLGKFMGFLLLAIMGGGGMLTSLCKGHTRSREHKAPNEAAESGESTEPLPGGKTGRGRKPQTRHEPVDCQSLHGCDLLNEQRSSRKGL